MAIAENRLDSLLDINPYVSRLYAVGEAEDFVNALSEYLASWSKQKIENLQRLNGGWGPFNYDGQPARLRTVADVTWKGDMVRRQLVALKEAGFTPNPELVELDQFFSIAKQVAEDRVAISSRKYSGIPRWSDHPRRSKGQASSRDS
jgi:hypothetical protein